MVGSETDWAKQKRMQKNAQMIPPPTEETGVESGVENFHTDIDIRDKRLESRDKRSDTDNRDIPDTSIETDNHEIEEKTASCAEPPVSGRSTPKKKPEPTPSEFNLLLSDNTTYNVPQENIEVYRGLYPGVDVEQQLRNMAGWCMSAGPNRKTRRGIKKFITGWLIREQDKASKKGGRNGANRSGAGQGAGGYKPIFDGETVV
jgi:hypothetical protein